MAGQEFARSLDARLQVTTIPLSVYNQHFSDQPVNSLCSLLQIGGTAGQEVPYLGYIETMITFAAKFLGVVLDVCMLAFVLPNVKPVFQSQVLIGMNILDSLSDLHQIEIPVGCSMVVKGFNQASPSVMGILALNEQLSIPLLGDLCLRHCLVHVPLHRPHHLSIIMITNESYLHITLTPLSIIAVHHSNPS